jgi:hypothetical protein
VHQNDTSRREIQLSPVPVAALVANRQPLPGHEAPAYGLDDPVFSVAGGTHVTNANPARGSATACARVVADYVGMG